jgi:beta-phosphoglucomutase-like phosphatase (HAD superfamily)
MRVIIFDMDGVLVESMPYHYQAMKTAIKDFTYPSANAINRLSILLT